MDLWDGECGEIYIEAESVPKSVCVPEAIAAFGDDSRFVAQSLHRTTGPAFVEVCQNAGLGFVIRSVKISGDPGRPLHRHPSAHAILRLV